MSYSPLVIQHTHWNAAAAPQSLVKFYTSKVPSQGEWTFIGGGCSGSDCFSSIGNSHQTCATTTWSGQAGLDYSIIKDILKITGSASHESSKSECITSTWTTQCRWTDGKCHNLWFSDSQIMYKGYIRRRCNYGDGDKTVWAKSYDAYVPTGNSLVGCDALCSDDAYPEPVP
ncbi:hypothetical protein MPH_00308 [Macrophomina phaseolina MS6]|uniref:Uncharacterized protein n=1 Tax=Macrophomina phaseolina (strain MS6) TaxID=1126212 RepID=K2S5V5_MACPH|nr:hypothetical protein MPH_00308 [Macrophomina phaseolina MS6]